MRRGAWFGLAAAGMAVGAATGAAVLAGRAWDRDSARLAERVLTAGRGAPSRPYDPAELAGLPAPVARYFRFALTHGQPRVRTARIRHAGEFRAALDAPWSPFRSVQHVSADPAGFVWDARIAMVPVLGVRVRDHYLGGRAGMLGKAAGAVTVVDRAGTPELASGALHRHLAESAWVPTALLPRPGLAWEAVDDTTARATLIDAGVTVSLDVHFAPTGEILRVTGDRYRDVDGVGVPTPFEGSFRDYAEVEGMRIPMAGEVSWILPEGRLTYWRGRIVGIEYDFGGQTGGAPARWTTRSSR